MMRRRPRRRRERDSFGKELAYRAQKILYTFMGPAQLDPRDDPLVRIERERQQRLAERAKQRKRRR